MASTRANYVKIGIFVSLAVTIALVAAIALGARSYNKEENLMETYIENSVQGLDVGSAVKFRGIPIGKIKEISFVWPTYNAPDTPEGQRAMRYARIVFTVDHQCLDKADNIPFAKLVDDGLRIYVKSQGITGLMYLNMDFASTPFARTMLPVPWEPKYPYVPSAPGLDKAIIDVIDSLNEHLSGLDLRGSLTTIVETVALVRDELREAKIGEAGQRLNTLLTRLDSVVTDFKTWSEGAGLDNKAKSAFSLLSSFEQSAKALEEALPVLLKNATEMTGNLNAATSGSRTQLAEALENIRIASETLNTILDRIKERPSMLIRDPANN